MKYFLKDFNGVSGPLYKCGMYGGKFLPFHKGHQFCCKVASLLCEKIYVIIFINGKDEDDMIKADPRIGREVLTPKSRIETMDRWLTKNVSNAELLVIDIDKLKLPNGEDDWDAETPLVLNLCKGRFEVTFGSEENYNDYFTRAYPWAEYILIDPKRITVPISGTMLRNMTLEDAKEWMK